MTHCIKHRLAQLFTNFLSLKIFRHILSKTLDFLNSSMDSLFFSSSSSTPASSGITDDGDDDFLFGGNGSRTTRPIQQLSDLDDEKLYLVDHRWWDETRESAFSEISGVLYSTKSSLADNFDSEIILDMRRMEEESDDCKEEKEEGVSGREFALVSEWMFMRAIKWHNDMKNFGNSLAGRDNKLDLFSLQIRLSILGKTNSLVVRISEKDNEVGAFDKCCKIFSVKSGLLRIWDFSGQTTRFFLRGQKLFNESEQPTEEISLELQVYGLSSYTTRREYEVAIEDLKNEDSHSSSLLQVNGNSDSVNSHVSCGRSPLGSLSEAYNLGLTGLYNLGNTCFMNSAIQCLVHTPQLVDYFLGDFRKDLNFENPLGMNGKLALAFGDLLRQLWAPGASYVAPREFKSALADFAPQFSGYNQHDSQEFLAFLLDGLHEDLNRVKSKPYIEVKDADGLPDIEVANEHWGNHLARNDSIIVDMCQGQYRSILICPVCKKQSVTFDPFMYLSLPLPSTTMRTMTLTVVSTDGTNLPVSVTVTVPKYGSYKDLIEALSTACSLGDDETLLVAEVYNNCILHFLDKPSDLDLVRDNDRLVAYRFHKDDDGLPLVVFTHRRFEIFRSYFQGSPSLRKFGIPLVARISENCDGSEIRKRFFELLNPFLMPDECSLDDFDDSVNTADQDIAMDDMADTTTVNGDSDTELEGGSPVDDDFQFHLDQRGFISEGTKIEMDEPLLIPESREIYVLVSWPEKMLKRYDTALLSNLPEVCGLALFTKRPPESVSLYKCLEAFLKEEPLGPEDMWYCPKCTKHRQASKKLDLWRLPEILVIHLKRFSYNRFLKDKLETFVDFPIDDFDLSNYTVHKNSPTSSHRYKLYAISNHYGVMGGGHYTAFVQCGGDRWYEFDDSHVFPVDEDRIKTSAAYVLFYRRI